MIRAEITLRYMRGPMAGQFITEIKEFDDVRQAQMWFDDNRVDRTRHAKREHFRILRDPLL